MRGDFVFYERFVQLCRQKGVAPSRAAEEAGISKSLVSKWKSGAAKVPSGEVLRKLADYFAIPLSSLLEDAPQAPAAEPRDILDEIDVAFYGDFKELSQQQQEAVRDMVRVMRERRQRQ